MAQTEEKQTTTAQEEEQNTGAQATEQQDADNGLPKTQEELNALIEKRLARERKKLAKQQGTQPAGGAQQTEQNGDAATAQQAVDTSAQDALNRELLIAKAQLAAYREGVSAAAVEDAVMLAVMQAEKAGEADEEGVQDALKEVLKRHPEWKPQKKDDKKGGFKVGVDTTGTEKSGASQKALPSGRVIF